jgi:hypothetical protein
MNKQLLYLFGQLLFMLFLFMHASAQNDFERNDWKIYSPEKLNATTGKLAETLANDLAKDAFFQFENISVEMDTRLSMLIAKHVKINDSLKTIPGYRVQIFSGSGPNSRAKADEAMSEFLKKYPDMPVNRIYESPNFYIRVGDFRDRLEALKFASEIKSIFPGCYIRKDNINFPKLSIE